jgi:RND superfamily putative drug exporter
VVTFAAVAAIVVAPAAIALLGDRLDALDTRRLFRWLLGRPDPVRKAVQQMFWYRSTKFVMRRSIPIGVAIVAILLLLGAPFLGIKWGFPDDRVLPQSASAREVGDELRNDFAVDSSTNVTVVIPDSAGVSLPALDRYATELSQVVDVSSVSSPGGTFVDGRFSGPPAAATGMRDGSAFLTIGSTAPLFTDRSNAQLDAVHAVSTPGGKPILVTGLAQVNRDSSQAITSRLPLVLGAIAVITFVLLFLLTGSVVLPFKALVLNVLSLTAAFGALVWIFQDGHLGALGTTPTGTLVANMPVLLFCIAFGLSMDYEVFLVSRIREYWLKAGAGSPATEGQAETRADGTPIAPRVRNDESVALGLAKTGRVVTAAALLMSISFAALIAAEVSFMKMMGVGMTLAIIADATLVRMALVPAFMHLLGRWNWWAPKPLAKLHERIGISESGDDPAPAPATPTAEPAATR